MITYVSSIYDAFPKVPEGGEGISAIVSIAAGWEAGTAFWEAAGCCGKVLEVCSPPQKMADGWKSLGGGKNFPISMSAL